MTWLPTAIRCIIFFSENILKSIKLTSSGGTEMITASSLPSLPKKNLPGDRNHSWTSLGCMLPMLVSVEQDDEEKAIEEKQTGHRSIRDGTSSSGAKRVRALFLFIFKPRQKRACLLMKKKSSFGRLLNCVLWGKTCADASAWMYFRSFEDKRKKRRKKSTSPKERACILFALISVYSLVR